MTIQTSNKEHLYRPFHDEEDSESLEGTPFIQSEPRQKSYIGKTWPWIASTILLLCILGYIQIQQQFTPWCQCHTATPTAFRTDLQDAHPHVVYEEREFSGRLWFNENTQTVYRDIDPSEPQYFGPPSSEIDAAWSDLLRGEFVRMTADEAAPYTPAFTRDPDTNYYYFEPDMFHSLHCLNAVRKELDSDYYSKQPLDHMDQMIQNSSAFPPDWHRVHMDHCLDQLRQAIQCQGDLSPVPLYHHQGVPIGLGVGQTHTCRKWEPMRLWMDERKKRHHEDLNW